MQTIQGLIQGDAAWHAHRAQHFNASDAPAMLGCSPYQTRAQLLQRMATGVAPEVDGPTQRRFDNGHRFEALARPLAEEIIGDDLAPVIGVLEGTRLSASFDGLTLMGDTAFEHKSVNAELWALFTGCDSDTVADLLPKHYRVQMEQQLLVSGAEQVLFMASEWTGDGTLVRECHCMYASNPRLRAEILAGWRQFEQDLAAYTPQQIVDQVEIVARRPDQLPALRSSVTGELVLESNIKEWEEAALAYIKSVRDHELKTDEDFANADAAAKWCDTSKTTLEGVKAQLMSATGDVNVAVGTLNRIMSELDETRIKFENAIKKRKEARKAEIVMAAATALREHMVGLNQRLGKPYMPQSAGSADFAGALKGMRSFDNMQDAVETLLANSKIAANETADRIEINLRHLRENAAEYAALFPDTSTIVLKAPEDLQSLVTARITEHRAAEERRAAELAERERARIRAEEQAKAQREAAEAEQRRKDEEYLAGAEEREQRRQAEIAGAVLAVRAGNTILTPAAATIASPAAVAPAANVVPMGTRAPDTGARLRLGEINAKLAPIALTADGLASLGFEPVATEKAAKLYAAADFHRICAALIDHVAKVSGQQKAA